MKKIEKIALFAATVTALASCQNKERYDATGIFEADEVTVCSETSC